MTNKLKTYSNYIKDPLALFYDLTKDALSNTVGCQRDPLIYRPENEWIET